MSPLVLCSLGLIFAVGMAGIFFCQLRKQLALHEAMAFEFKRAESELSGLAKRFTKMHTHALDYMNSLGPDLTHEIYNIQQILAAANTALKEVEVLIASEDVPSLVRAQALMGKHFDINVSDEIQAEVVDEERYEVLSRGWKLRVEKKMQNIGKAVADASQRATDTGIPKRRKRLSTHLSLKQLGVIDLDQSVLPKSAGEKEE